MFSGFRNKEWEQIIETNKGKIGSGISSKVDFLVTNQEDIIRGTNSKIIKAKELNITIMNKEDFEKQFIK